MIIKVRGNSLCKYDDWHGIYEHFSREDRELPALWIYCYNVLLY